MRNVSIEFKDEIQRENQHSWIIGRTENSQQSEKIENSEQSQLSNEIVKVVSIGRNAERNQHACKMVENENSQHSEKKIRKTVSKVSIVIK